MITNNISRNAGRGLGVYRSPLVLRPEKNFGDKSFLIAASIPMSEGLKEGELCPKCSSIIGRDGLCWKCLIESGK